MNKITISASERIAGIEAKAKSKRVYTEAEKSRRREAELKRMEDPEYRARKRAVDRLRLQNKEARDRKRAIDRERRKRQDVLEKQIEALKRFKETDRYEALVKKTNERNRIKSLVKNIGKICEIVLVKCLECGCIETKRPHLVKDGKASSAYCTTHAKAHRRSHGVDYKIFNIICSDCGNTCIGAANRKVCDSCRKIRSKALKKTKHAIEAKRMLGGSSRRRAMVKGCYVDTVRPNKVFERNNWICVGCGVKVVKSLKWQPNQATVDHIIPISRGGSHTYENCQTMCMVCNSKKEAKMPLGRQLTVFDRVT